MNKSGTLSHAGNTPIAALSAQVQRYAAKPYGTNAEGARQYHLAAYRAWCAAHNLEPFPLDIQRLLHFATFRARTYAFFTVREDVRIVAMEHRKATGEDLYCDTRVAHVLAGLRRTRPPRPVTPLRTGDFEQILAHRGKTWKTRRSRVMAMLIWAAGFTINELRYLDREMLAFEDRGVHVRFPSQSDLRESIFIGRAVDSNRCPVRALEDLIAERTILSGPVFHRTPRHKPQVRLRFAYAGIVNAVALLGVQVGFRSRLTVERIRRGGLIAQSEHVDIVTLAHFHGLRCIANLASFIDAKTERPARYIRRRRHSH